MSENILLPFPAPEPEGDTWQAAVARFPGWVDDDDVPYRPKIAVAVSADSGLVGSSDVSVPTTPGADLVQEAIDSLAEIMGQRPAKIEIDDPELLDALTALTKGEGIVVECRKNLPLLAEPMEEMAREIVKDESFVAANRIPGVTIDHLRAFAEAAGAFHEAAPWRLLDSSDIIEVGAPRPAPNVRYACILNAYGEQGLGLAEGRSLLDMGDADEEEGAARLATESLWSVTFCDPWEVPIAEHDLWLDEGLPTDPTGRIPAAVQYGPKRRIRRASPKMLAFFEGLFLALARSTEDQLDSGEWEMIVETSQGRLELSLSLPDVLAPPPPRDDELPPFNPLRSGSAMDAIRDLLNARNFESEEEMRAFLDSEIVGRKIPDPKIEGPSDEARELAIEAMDTPGRRGTALARRALKLDPDSPFAHLALALRSRDLETAIDRYRTAADVAERALGPEYFNDEVGSFWLISETRPYMEAVKGLADSLWLDDQRLEAVEHYAQLLRLNPNDNQGIRDRLAPALIAMGKDEAAETLLGEYAKDITAAHHFNHALVTFRRKGKGKTAEKRLRAALEANSYVPDLLFGELDLPEELPDGFTLGSMEEAIFYFLEAAEAWQETPGALDWLADAITTD